MFCQGFSSEEDNKAVFWLSVQFTVPNKTLFAFFYLYGKVVKLLSQSKNFGV